MVGRTLADAIAALPEARRANVDERFRQLKDEVESLAELRRAAGKSRAQIAAALKINQPSVSKIEKQTDMYLSTLKSYVEAIGGQLELVVHFRTRTPLRIERLGDCSGAKSEFVSKAKSASPRRRATVLGAG